MDQWPAELLVFTGDSGEELLAGVERVERGLAAGARPRLRDLAFSLWQETARRQDLRLGMVADSLEDLRPKLAAARESLGQGSLDIDNPGGIYCAQTPLAATGKVAFLFPGQGSQYCGMLDELAVHFSCVRERYELADRALADHGPDRLSRYVFPPPAFGRDEEQALERGLRRTEIAQPALGAAGMGMLRLLEALGIAPDLVAGHSYGEYVALCAAGVISEEGLYVLSRARGQAIVDAADESDLGTMASAAVEADRAADLIQGIDGVVVANVNAPRQSAISGTQAGVQTALDRFETEGIQARLLPVACAFHSPLMAPAGERFRQVLAETRLGSPSVAVFSNTLAAPYPLDPKAIAELLADHLVRPVRFADELAAMHRDGARVFVEVGPRAVLTGLARQVLDERPHLAVATDGPGASGVVGLLRALAQLAANGVRLDLGPLFAGRAVRRLDLAALEQETLEQPLPPTTWLVNGGRASPCNGAERTAQDQPVPRATDASPPEAPQPAPNSSSDRDPERASIPEHPTSHLGPNEQVRTELIGFQRLMDRFLETQEQVMLAYLQGGSKGRPGSAPAVEPPALATTPESNGSGPLPVSSDQDEARGEGLDAGATEPDGVREKGPSAEPPSDPEEMLDLLIGIASDRTGYPRDLLDPEVNVEAELGIDSIKFVEIVGMFQQQVLPPGHVIEGLGERLAETRTLREVVDLVAGSRECEVDLAGKPEPELPIEAPTDAPAIGSDGEVPRFVPAIADAPPAVPSNGHADGALLVTDDGGGVADTLAAALSRQGRDAVVIHPANLRDRKAVDKLIAGVRDEHRRVAGIVYLPAPGDGIALEELDAGVARERLSDEAGALLRLTQAAAADLRAGGERDGCVLAATWMGGAFGLDDRGVAFSPTQGATAGYVKTLALEWPAVRARVVDLDPSEEPRLAAERLLSELAADCDQVEVGYRDGRRVTLSARPAPLTASGAGPELDRDSVVLATGGARGITAQVARELAERCGATLVLVGRSPLPAAEDSSDVAGIESPQELKAILIERLRAAGERPTPTAVEALLGRLTQNREMRGTLAAIEAAGAGVDYRQVDVSDPTAFGALIDALYEEYGRIDGVIHGAGVIEDKLIEDKAEDSFWRVLDTKAASALVLARKLRPESLRFLTLFSSVAGRFGNLGQADYAAANEVLARLASYLNARWPARVVALDWGPWAVSGMASAGVLDQFKEHGLQPIQPGAGRRAFMRELTAGAAAAAEVILGFGPWVIEPGAAPDGQATAAVTRSRERNGAVPIGALEGGEG